MFFKWALTKDWITRNFAENVKIPDNKKTPDQKKRPFTVEQVQTMFKPETYFKSTEAHASRYWVPLIGLLTGMRQNEICQLEVNDIIKEDSSGYWYFNITVEGEDKKLKNNSSWGKVPISQHLIDLGFLEYVDGKRVEGQVKIFPELKKHGDRYGKEISKLFNEIFKRKFLSIDERKHRDFHSFRRFFIDNLKQNLVREDIRSDISGHSTGSMQDLYTNKFEVKTMMEEGIMKFALKLDWDGLKKDWNHPNETQAGQ